MSAREVTGIENVDELIDAAKNLCECAFGVERYVAARERTVRALESLTGLAWPFDV